MGDNGHIRRYVVRIIPRKDCRCVVKSCPANLGTDGCLCDFAYTGTPCNHPVYRVQWHDRGAYYPHFDDADADDPVAEPQTLTARVAEAQSREKATVAQVRAKAEQLALELEV